MSTPVLFRVEHSGPWAGDVIACLPTIPGSDGLGTCYAHVGQHSSYSWLWYSGCTRAATPEEYAPLLAELITLGYTDLVVRKRETLAMRRGRQKNLAEYLAS